MLNGINYSFRTRALKKHYITGETRVQALRGIDIEIPEAEIVVLLGPSGSGKSTFLNIIGGLDTPSSGHVYFREQDLAKMTSRELTLFRRDSVGFVFQAYNLVPSLTGLENVELVTEISKNSLSPMEALEVVGLSQRAHHFPSQMSGGEQQRVAIARALAKRPQVLLCDEPTGALDSETGVGVLKALVDVNQRYATTCIIITHNASIALLAHRVIHFSNGDVVRVETHRQRKSPSEIGW